jgi:hypothetical protein
MIPIGWEIAVGPVLCIGLGAPRLDRIGTTGIRGTTRNPRAIAGDFRSSFHYKV